MAMSRPALGKRRKRLASACFVFLAACGNGSGPVAPSPELSATRVDSAGVIILTLSHTLEEVADGEILAQIIEPDLLVGETEEEEEVWFGSIADVTSMGQGRFAVLDHMQARVLLIDSLGGLSGTLGRKGDGPGEFNWPWALTRFDSALVVRENSPTRAFTIFDADGTVRATAPSEPEGDWANPMFRVPDLRIRGFQMGPEDVTRRLQPFGANSFIHMLQVNENADMDFESPPEFEALPTFLIRYDSLGRLLDTLAVLAGPPTHVNDIWPGQTIFYTQPIFSGRPVWATGEDWYAIGHGDSTEVVVRDTIGLPFLRVRMPNRRRAISEGDRRAFGNWGVAATFTDSPASMERARERGASVLVQLHDWWMNAWEYADSIPTVTAAYGTGKCLFLSGFRASDWHDGTSLTWVVIDVRTGRVLRTIRLREPIEASLPSDRFFSKYLQHGAVVRDFDGEFSFTFRRMADDAPVIERFPLSLRCNE